MKRAPRWTRAGVVLLLLVPFATPLHLAVEAHEWHHQESGEEHPHDSDQATHPAVDHELTALAKAPRFLLFPVAITVLDLHFLAPDLGSWVPAVEPDAPGPPADYGSPPRSPRAPPA